jgi:signal transduction histidine kinase
VRGKLTPRMVIASGLLAVIVGVAFAILLAAVSELRDSGRLAQHSFTELARANRLERLVIDLETGLRGFVLTGEERFLEPYTRARTAFPAQAAALAAFADDPGQRRRARQIAEAGGSYIDGYAAALVRAARRGDRRASSVAATEEGKRRVDALRALFARYERIEAAVAEADQDRSDSAARRAMAAAAAGLAGSVILILFFAGYLLHAIVLPVRRAAAMAVRLAGGDLAVRLPETGTGEIGELERAFNTMGRSLEQNRDALQLLADEQAALRRVATLVAHRVAPRDLFAAVATEVASLLGAESARLLRYETNGTAVVVADHSEPWARVPLGTQVPLDGEGDPTQATATRASVRIDDFATVPGPSARLLREMGLCSGVAQAIVVDGRLWGMMAAAWARPGAPPGAEERLSEFTELVATAIANAESRAQLAASRARVVAAGDETRRRIERDLHDGAQQRLVSLSLELRAIEARVPAELHELKGQLAEVATGVAEVTEELREMSRGIHPAILSRGGLAAAVRALARRSAVPVDVDVSLDRPLPERVEVAAYYVASEALTNAAKHAQASAVSVELAAEDGSVRLLIRDDGVGGADPTEGSGLLGLKDRVEALGGTIEIASPAGAGTSLLVVIPTREGASDGAPRLS